MAARLDQESQTGEVGYIDAIQDRLTVHSGTEGLMNDRVHLRD